MKDITIAEMQDWISSHRIVGSEGKPFWGFINSHFADGYLQNYEIRNTIAVRTSEGRNPRLGRGTSDALDKRAR